MSARNFAAQLSVMADHVDRYHHDLGHIVTSLHEPADGDVVVIAVEAERALRTAAQLLRRASATAGRAAR